MATTRNVARTITSLVALALLLTTSQACYDDDATQPPAAVHPPSLLDEDLGEPPHMLALARAIPGFAGLHLEPNGERLVISLTESDHAVLGTAQEAVSTILTAGRTLHRAIASPPVRFVSRVVDNSFVDLARHRARLRSHVFDIPGVASLSVDEEFNRVDIGLADMSARDDVLDLAIDLDVPLETLSFSQTVFMQSLHMAAETPGPQLSESPTLQDRISTPDGRLRGGYEISSPKTYAARQGCTLGFTAIPKSGAHAGSKVAVTAAHCSWVPYMKDDWPWYQDGGGSFMGRELLDPQRTYCHYRTLGVLRDRPCRNADANMLWVEDSIDIALGDIGRTKEKDDCDQCSATVEVDGDSPIIRIRSQDGAVVDNEPLHKIGKRTGWTYGNVEDTCVDRKLEETGILIQCTDRVDFSVKSGDHGAPVFEYSESDGTAQLRGIVIGWQGSWWDDGIMSNLTQIFKDLGEMWAYDPGPPEVSIQGPDEVPPDTRCYWTAVPTYGMTPFGQSIWSGVLNGTTESAIVGTVEESGWLRVERSDLLGRVGQDSMYIDVQDDSSCPEPGSGGGGGDDPGGGDNPLAGPPPSEPGDTE